MAIDVLDKKMLSEFSQDFLSKGHSRNPLRMLEVAGEQPKSIKMRFIGQICPLLTFLGLEPGAIGGYSQCHLV